MGKDKQEWPTGACGHPVNSNGNCFSPGCWNNNSKRYEDGRAKPKDV